MGLLLFNNIYMPTSTSHIQPPLLQDLRPNGISLVGQYSNGILLLVGRNSYGISLVGRNSYGISLVGQYYNGISLMVFC